MTAVVTGGSRGIGRAIVERLCREGVDVVFNYSTSEDAAADVVRVVQSDGGNARAVCLDLEKPEAPEQLMETAEAHLGGLDILVNNAAVAHSPVPLAQTEAEVFDSVMAINTKSVFLTMRYAARQMRDGGRIVNISTMNTVRPVPGIGPYVASKGAIEQLTAVAARELGPRGITVNAVSPGATDTEMLRGANPPETLRAVAGMTPLGRLGEASDVAAVVAFLAGPEGRWITGQNLRVTGGLA
ncbi:glucose 1-dehydrogenase [Streptomyces sp. SID9727]|uniref:SDR family NAD(P)-dependent oxidoreductase n=1 Tax=Streptomyces sp. SID9727 TaxID=2706114 RepID=UPI0013C84938|nr:glucose 1-dehydrogenase [Streptomyces sp. SID9727]NEC68825.1 SDR family oxidoreductase [Streptomyces sp. SID9727]